MVLTLVFKMKFISSFLILFLGLVLYTNAQNENEVETTIPYNIKYFWMKNCYKYHPGQLQFQNVKLKTASHRLIMSGIMIVKTALIAPITVNVNLKRKFWGTWFPIPCVNNVGTCTYHDACQFGVSENDICPDNFDETDFPCRCPIYQGTYNLTDGIKVPNKIFTTQNWINGQYGGQVTVKKGGKEIACYNIGFVLY